MEASEADDPVPSQRRREPPPQRRRRPPPPPREPAGDLLKRRFIAFGIGIVVVVLLLLGLRSCLDARKERSYENYLRDLESLVTTSSQLSQEFFDRFRDPGGASELEFQAQLGSSRGTSEDLLNRVQGLDTPGELADAQEDLELAFELRRDGVTSVVEQIETALGDQAQEATDEIATDMRQFLASDVLYARAADEINEVLGEEGLEGEVPSSSFLPEPIEPWLDRLEIARLLAQVAGDTGAAGDATRGTELSTVTITTPGNLLLTPDTLNTSGQIPTEIEVGVLNGGTSDETDVVVAYELLGSTEPIAQETTIPRINPAEEGTAVLQISGEIPTDEELTLIVTVFPVPGESIVDNNELAFQVSFGG